MSAKVIPLRDSQQNQRDTSGWSDKAVAAACSTGDPLAVAELFDRFQTPVTRFLSRMVGPTPDIEDLVQSTFLEVARGKARFDGRSAVRTWVFGIAANIARHHLRTLSRRGRLSRAFSFFAERGGHSGATSGPQEVTEAKRKLSKVGQMLDELPQGQRESFILCELEGLSAKQAAQALGTTEKAVWKRVSKARKALREAAGQEGF